MEFTDKIAYLRKKYNLTYEQIAQFVGVGKSTVRKWETGQIKNIGRSNIAKLSKALHTTPEYLMGWSDDETPKELSDFDIKKRNLIEKIDLINDEDTLLRIQKIIDAIM